jgi:hypothetical protein
MGDCHFGYKPKIPQKTKKKKRKKEKKKKVTNERADG